MIGLDDRFSMIGLAGGRWTSTQFLKLGKNPICKHIWGKTYISTTTTVEGKNVGIPFLLIIPEGARARVRTRTRIRVRARTICCSCALALTLVLVLTLALVPSAMISKKGVPTFFHIFSPQQYYYRH